MPHPLRPHPKLPEGLATPQAATPAPEWDLRDLFASPDDPAIEALMQAQAAQAQDFAARHQGRVAMLDGAGLAGAIEAYQAIEENLSRVLAYAQLIFAADSTAPEAGRFYQAMTERATGIGTSLVFFTLEINRIEEGDLAPRLDDPALAPFTPWLRDLRVFRPHQLSDEMETLLHEKEVTGHAAWSRLFDETLAGLRVAVGEEELTLAAAMNRLSDADRARREAAARAVGVTLARNSKLFSLIINTIAKDKQIADRWRRYPTPVSYRNQANMVEDEVVAALAEAVTQSYPRLSHRYYTMKARWLGLGHLEFWDRNAPLPGDEDRLIPWPEARARVLDAYHAFSPAMAAIAGRFFEQGWIDARPRPGKSGGAFSHATVPSAHPYILMNYEGRPRDVMTLAHELGHGVHQTLAARQGYLMAATPLTLAETASVFGEMLVFRALLDAEADPARRRLMLARKVEDMLNTVVRQIAFYQFETKFHAARRRDELLPEEIAALWLEVQPECLGPAFSFAEEYRMFWASVPHFIHAPFYVYAYAFGDCLVNTLYGVYQEARAKGEADGFASLYLDMLRAGGTMRHAELLAPFGLDAADPQFWRRGLDIISGFIDELATGDHHGE